MNVHDLSSILLHVGILAAAAAFAVYAWKAHKRRLRAWRDFADRHCWTYSEDREAFRVHGFHRGIAFSMHTEHRRSGKSSQLFTVVRLPLDAALPAELRIVPERFGDKLLKALGKGDDETGDAELDAALEIRNLTDEAREALRAPRVREQLLRLRKHSTHFAIQHEALQVEKRGMPDRVEALESFVVPALELADALLDLATKAREHQSG